MEHVPSHVECAEHSGDPSLGISKRIIYIDSVRWFFGFHILDERCNIILTCSKWELHEVSHKHPAFSGNKTGSLQTSATPWSDAQSIGGLWLSIVLAHRYHEMSGSHFCILASRHSEVMMRLVKSATSRNCLRSVAFFHLQLQQLSLAVFFETELPLRIKDGRGNWTICGSSAQIKMGFYGKWLLD